jgi:DNA-binding response OmpR family regulator/tetratricopeptide (TPR) repeat protein
VLEVSLRKAGFSVTPAVSVGDALDKLEVNAPDLIISETKFATDLDGFELRRRLRNMPEWAEIPFIFLTAETAIENKIKGLELGVDDYLTKPIYIKEIVTRINILLQKRQRQFLDLRKDGTRFAGRVADMPVVDVIQTIEVSRKSGIIQFTGPVNRQAAIYFRDGKVIDAEAGTLQGEDAVYRLLTWSEGEFEVEFRTVRRREVIAASSQGLLMEGMRRLDEWSRLLEQLPPLTHRFEIDAGELSGRLGEVPDDNNKILRLFDGKRTLLEVIDSSDFGDLECLQAVSRLYFEGLLIDLDPSVRTKRETGKPGPLVMVDDAHPTPMEEAASGPIDLRRLESRASGNAQPAPLAAASPPSPPPPKAGSLTMGWDAQPDPTSAAAVSAPVEPPPTAGKLTMGWDAQPDPTENVALASPAEVAADAPLPRARRDSGVQIDDQDVVGEEEVHGPLSGGYRPSSLRLIDEAVAAAQLIEPSLFEPEELARLGIKPKASAEPSQAATEEAAAIARVKAELTASDPSLEKRDTLETPAQAAPLEKRDTLETPAAASPDDIAAKPRTTSQSTPPPMPPNGTPRGRKKTVPPPVPRAPAKVSPRIEDVPMLDSNLLTSGEHKIPDNADLDDSTPLIDVDMLTSGEFKIPTPAQLEAQLEAQLPLRPPAPLPKAMPLIRVPLPDEGDDGAAPEPDDYSGVPTVIEAEGEDEDDGSGDVGGPTNLELPSRRISQPMKREDSQAVRMIGSYGKDRAEAAGELRPPNTGRAPTEPGTTQRELVTILPRRKTGEISQLRAEDVAAKQAEKSDATKPGSNGASANAAAKDAAAEAKAKPEAKADGKGEAKPAAKTDAPAAKSDAKAKPAVEPPSTPARRVSVEGGVVAPSSGPGRGAQILIAVASLLAAATVFTLCRKEKPANTPVVDTRNDAALVVESRLDATEYSGFGIDAGMAAAPRDAQTIVQVPADAAPIVQTPRDAGTIVQAPRDAATVAVATADAGIDKAKEARALFDKAHAALEDGDADQALQLLDQSLKLKRQARTLLERARALQRLRRIDDAIGSIDDAIKMNDSYAPAWEQKGMLLWSEKKYAEARPALEMYLQLAPDGARAATIRSMLDEPR